MTPDNIDTDPENNREKWAESNRNRMSRPRTPAPSATPNYAFETETCTLGLYLSQFPLSSEVHQKICVMVNELVREAKAEAARAATLKENKRVLDVVEPFVDCETMDIIKESLRRQKAGEHPDKKTGTYPATEEDIRIPIDSQTNYK